MISFDWKGYLKKWDLERCGFILNNGAVVELPNSHVDPMNAFSISRLDAEEYKGKIAAIWHTHCSDNYNLSMTDYDGFLEHPDFTHFIISYAGVASYKVDGQHIINIQRRVFDGKG